MTIKYFVETLNHLLKKRFKDCSLEVYLSRGKRHVHIAFKKPLMSVKTKDEIIQLIFTPCEKYDIK